MRRIVLYPLFDAFYHSFYIQGIRDLFGPSSVSVSSRDFPHLPSGCFAFIFRGSKDLRVVIDAFDGSVITNYNLEGLKWCDVYGKINLDHSAVPEGYAHKCVPIGPSFAVQVWNPILSWWIALRNYRSSVDYSSREAGINSTREHFANYRRQYKYRLRMKHYTPAPSKTDYVFFTSTLWKDEEAPGTNEYRARFIETCKAHKGLTFEGGLVPSAEWPIPKRLARVASPRVSYPEWLKKTKSSALVFNTPAVWSCHGFKLGEFLALGKAIISTPPVRELPSPLIHTRHIHYVDGSVDSIRRAVDLLLNDEDYRVNLEKNAYEYYTSVLSPTRVIERLLDLR